MTQAERFRPFFVGAIKLSNVVVTNRMPQLPVLTSPFYIEANLVPQHSMLLS
jgi:hypothetical protein